MSGAAQTEASPTNSPFLAFIPAGEDLQTAKTFAESQGWPETSVHEGNISDATRYLANHPSPELLLVDIPSEKEAPALLDALAEVCDPTTKVVVSGLINQYSFYCWLTEIGIFHYMLRPFTEEALEAVYQKSLKQETANQSQEKPPGKVIAVLGTRGGVGASTVALNLAGLLAEQTKQQTTLVDLDAKEGSIALSLDMEPCRGFREVLEKPDRIDSLFIARVMTKIGKYLQVLSAEESIAEELSISPQAADLLLQELRTKFDFVVLDVPRHMNAFNQQLLHHADHIIVVTELSLLSLRDTIRLHDAMRETWKLKPAMMVANRVGLASKQEIPIQDFEKGAGCTITQSIRFAPDIWMNIGQEIPAVKHHAHEATKPYLELVYALAPQVKKPPVKKAKPAFSFFKKKGT